MKIILNTLFKEEKRKKNFSILVEKSSSLYMNKTQQSISVNISVEVK